MAISYRLSVVAEDSRRWPHPFSEVLTPTFGAQGGADISLDRLRRQPQAPTVLHRAHPAQPLLRPSLVVVPQVGVEHAAELRYRHPRPVAVVEELVLEPPEKPSIAELSGLQPFLDIDLASPFLSHMAIQPGQR